MPIPDPRSPLRYRDLRVPEGASKIVHNLSRGRLVAGTRVHMDPDLAPDTLPRNTGWQALFGQHGAAQRHLQLQGVQPGDLFLFFGWFRQVQMARRRWYYVPDAPDIHLIFGWMHVGAMTPAAQMEADWAQYHPHFHGRFGTGNSLYTSTAEQLPWSPGRPSAGVFEHYRTGRVLSAPGCTRSIWRLPGWLTPRGPDSALSYHTDLSRWMRDREGVQLRTAARGQEFVLDLDDYPEAHDWISGLFQA